MKKKTYILTAIILIAILIIGFLIWWNYKKTTDRKYQACLEKCELEVRIKDEFKSGLDRLLRADAWEEACKAECREKYAQKSKK